MYGSAWGDHPSGHVNPGTEQWTQAPASLPVNSWSHLALTYNGTTARLYVDGAQVSQAAISGGPIQASTGALRIGGNAPWGEYFHGLIDEVRVYRKVLTAAEITADMAKPVVTGAPPAPGPERFGQFTAAADVAARARPHGHALQRQDRRLRRLRRRAQLRADLGSGHQHVHPGPDRPQPVLRRARDAARRPAVRRRRPHRGQRGHQEHVRSSTRRPAAGSSAPTWRGRAGTRPSPRSPTGASSWCRATTSRSTRRASTCRSRTARRRCRRSTTSPATRGPR